MPARLAVGLCYLGDLNGQSRAEFKETPQPQELTKKTSVDLTTLQDLPVTPATFSPPITISRKPEQYRETVRLCMGHGISVIMNSWASGPRFHLLGLARRVGGIQGRLGFYNIASFAPFHITSPEDTLVFHREAVQRLGASSYLCWALGHFHLAIPSIWFLKATSLFWKEPVLFQDGRS